MSIESKNYIATPSEIEKLAGDIIDGVQRIESGRGICLKAIVATTQAELKSEPRQRSGKGAKLSEAEIAEHLKAFQAVNDRFYAVVKRVAENTVPDPDKALVRQRTAFFRSAASTVRSYIRAGHDIRVLAAHKVTKMGLAAAFATRRKRKVTFDALKRRAAATAAELTRLTKSLAAQDRDATRTALEPMLAALAKAAAITDHATRDPKVALAERRPLQGARGMFLIPVDSGEHRLAA